MFISSWTSYPCKLVFKSKFYSWVPNVWYQSQPPRWVIERNSFSMGSNKLWLFGWILEGATQRLDSWMSAAERQGRSQEFLFGGPSVTLIYLSIQLLRTYIYTYARFFFIIYTRFLFDKLYIYKKKKKSGFQLAQLVKFLMVV